jgi:hypothetical protein
MLAESIQVPLLILSLSEVQSANFSRGFTRVPNPRNARSLSDRVNTLIQDQSIEFALLARPEVILDADFSAVVQALIAGLSKEYPNWGVCGATGARWDGQRTYWHMRQPPRNPEAGVCTRPVISVGSEVLLLNLKQLRAEGCSLEEPTANWWEVGPLLALECLKRSLCVLVDPRLMAVDTGGAPDLKATEAIQNVVRRQFLNHCVSLPWGAIEVPEVAYEEFLSLPSVSHDKRDLVSCYDAALARAHQAKPVTLTIACRSQFNRQYLLERAMLSFAAAQQEAPGHCELRVALISDVSSDKLQSEVRRWQSLFPSLSVCGLHVESRRRETSRIDHLLTSIAQIESDYLWFVDDDDFVMPGAVPALARVFVPEAPVLLVGSSEVLEESWEQGRLVDFHACGAHASKHVFDVFQGENFVPICGMVIPVKLARERCRHVEANGEYLEDYFILMRLLTSPRVEVEVLAAPIAGISLRGQENTVRQSHRDTWNRSYAQFVGELVRSADSSNPLLWQLVRKTA